MISIGIDISKEKNTVFASEQGSKIIWKPFDVYLNKTEVEELIEKLEKIKALDLGCWSFLFII